MRITKDEFNECSQLEKKNKKRALKEVPAEKPSDSSSSNHLQNRLKQKMDLSMKLSDDEIKKRLSGLAEETINQLSDPKKVLQDIEEIYLIFKGQMMVINRCHLLSMGEQQEQNAKVYASYYKRKMDLKKLELKNK